MYLSHEALQYRQAHLRPRNSPRQEQSRNQQLHDISNSEGTGCLLSMESHHASPEVLPDVSTRKKKKEVALRSTHDNTLDYIWFDASSLPLSNDKISLPKLSILISGLSS